MLKLTVLYFFLMDLEDARQLGPTQNASNLFTMQLILERTAQSDGWNSGKSSGICQMGCQGL